MDMLRAAAKTHLCQPSPYATANLEVAQPGLGRTIGAQTHKLHHRRLALTSVCFPTNNASIVGLMPMVICIVTHAHHGRLGFRSKVLGGCPEDTCPYGLKRVELIESLGGATVYSGRGR